MGYQAEADYEGAITMMTDATRYPLRKFAGVGLMILCGMLYPAAAQKAKEQLPVVIAGEMPLYPMMARAAWIQGVVKIKVTTDGKKVISADVESGQPMLAKFAKKNVLTWKFTEHKPTTFITTFEYVIEEPAQCGYSNDVLTLKLPLEVSISAIGQEICDPGSKLKPHP